MSNKNIAVIFAGGSGVRMGSGLPKQFLKVNGQPIIIYTLEIFDDHPDIDEIYIACKDEYISKLKKYIDQYHIQKVKAIVKGGRTGLESIYNALNAAVADNDEEAIVLIHDGVRPFITPKIITENIACVKKNGCAVTCTPMFETPIKSNDGNIIDEVVKRDIMYTAQAPQSFYLQDIHSIYSKIKEDGDFDKYVDSCSLYKAQGHKVALVSGNRGNIKVTTPEDLYLFKGLIDYQDTQQALGLVNEEFENTYQK